jgi:hypothetical protein
MIEGAGNEQEATFGTVDTGAFDKAFGSAQPTCSWSGFPTECKDGAELAGAAGGGQWLSSVEVRAISPAHGVSEVLVASTEVRGPGKQPEVGGGERLDLISLGQRS